MTFLGPKPENQNARPSVIWSYNLLRYQHLGRTHAFPNITDGHIFQAFALIEFHIECIGWHRNPHAAEDSINISGRRRQGAADFHIAVRRQPIVVALGDLWAVSAHLWLLWWLVGGSRQTCYRAGQQWPIVSLKGGSWAGLSGEIQKLGQPKPFVGSVMEVFGW